MIRWLATTEEKIASFQNGVCPDCGGDVTRAVTIRWGKPHSDYQCSACSAGACVLAEGAVVGPRVSVPRKTAHSTAAGEQPSWRQVWIYTCACGVRTEWPAGSPSLAAGVKCAGCGASIQEPPDGSLRY